MFIGHYAPALALRARTRKDGPGLATMFVAAQLVDLAFFTFVLADIEHMRLVPGTTVMNPMDLYHMPYTHSLAGTAAWAAGFGLLVRLITRSGRAGVVAGFVVLSHWFLDLLMHAPDLGLIGDAHKVGLGLWNMPAVAIPLELGLFGICFWSYARATRPKRPTGTLSLALLLVYLLVAQGANWLGEPPADVAKVAVQALVAYVVAILLALWVDRTRRRT